MLHQSFSVGERMEKWEIFGWPARAKKKEYEKRSACFIFIFLAPSFSTEYKRYEPSRLNWMEKVSIAVSFRHRILSWSPSVSTGMSSSTGSVQTKGGNVMKKTNTIVYMCLSYTSNSLKRIVVPANTSSPQVPVIVVEAVECSQQ